MSLTIFFDFEYDATISMEIMKDSIRPYKCFLLSEFGDVYCLLRCYENIISVIFENFDSVDLLIWKKRGN